MKKLAQFKQKTEAYINNVDELSKIFKGAQIKKVENQVKSINDNHKQNLITMHSVMLDLVEPSFDRIIGFGEAYAKFENAKLNKDFLASVNEQLPKWKTKHDDLTKKKKKNNQ